MLLEKQYVYEKFLEYTYYVFFIFCHTLFVIYIYGYMDSHIKHGQSFK